MTSDRYVRINMHMKARTLICFEVSTSEVSFLVIFYNR